MGKWEEDEGGTVDRLNRIERQNGRLLRGLALLGTLSAALGAVVIAEFVLRPLPATAQAAAGGRVEATEFVLKGADGKVRARLGMTKRGSPALILFGPDGKRRAGIFVSTEGVAGIQLFNPKGESRMEMKVDGTRSDLIMSDSNEARLRLGIEGDTARLATLKNGKRTSFIGVKNGIAAMALADADGNVRIGAVASKGEPKLELLTPNEEPVITLKANPKGIGLAIKAPLGKRGIYLFLGRKSHRIAILNKTGKPIWSKP